MFHERGLRALLVEPDRHFALIARQVLYVGGIREVHHELDAIRALEVLRMHPVDFAIVSSHLPSITALELTTLIRTAPDSPNPHLPILLLLGQPTKKIVQEAMTAGVNFCVRKPLSASILLERIEYVVSAQETLTV